MGNRLAALRPAANRRIGMTSGKSYDGQLIRSKRSNGSPGFHNLMLRVKDLDRFPSLLYANCSACTC
jgi:hypothetical protein